MENQNLKQKQEIEERIVRILSKDIPGNKKIYAGLTRIKGISWAVSNAICRILKIDKLRRIGSLNEKEINQIEEFMENPKFPQFIINRRFDFDSGEDKHLIGSSLDLRKEFDIKRLKKIKSYRGMRHAAGQPTRGQKTRSHFRTNRRRGTGIKKKK